MRKQPFDRASMPPPARQLLPRGVACSVLLHLQVQARFYCVLSSKGAGAFGPHSGPALGLSLQQLQALPALS